jgi:hypothetical protein
MLIFKATIANKADKMFDGNEYLEKLSKTTKNMN